MTQLKNLRDDGSTGAKLQTAPRVDGQSLPRNKVIGTIYVKVLHR